MYLLTIYRLKSSSENLLSFICCADERQEIFRAKPENYFPIFSNRYNSKIAHRLYERGEFIACIRICHQWIHTDGALGVPSGGLCAVLP